MNDAHAPEVLASHHQPGLSLFVVGEPADVQHPGNGGLRVMPYATDDAAEAEARMLAARMSDKHRLYRTGFRGAKLVARVEDPCAQMGQVLDRVHDLLGTLGGTVYTGCDLNVSAYDMAWLHRRCPYVLAAIGVSADASAATGHGVVGSLRACRERWDVRRVLVHGTGAVGRVVAERLVGLGLEVFTVDRDPRRAAVPGCTPVQLHAWAEVDVDALVPCSCSGLIDEAIANTLRARVIVSATNGPVRTPVAASILEHRGIDVVPDPLSNAGAVIVDSIEFFDPHAWRMLEAAQAYAFVERQIYRRTASYLEGWRVGAAAPDLAPLLHDLDAHPIGCEATPTAEAVA